MLVFSSVEITKSSSVKRLSFPHPFVEVQDATGLEGGVGIAGEDPGTVLPRADGILERGARLVVPAAHTPWP
jgi:hypothetical protein